MAHFPLRKAERSEPILKMSTIQIQYDTGKLCALRQCMPDETALEAGLEASLKALYEKYVPAEVREYIDSQKGGDAS